MEAGHTESVTRTFTRAMVDQFAQLSGDNGDHHVDSGHDGRVIVHGLLVATLPTEIGGRLNYMARTMTFEFVQPTWSGDTVTCTGTIESCAPSSRGTWADISFFATNQHGDLVMRGTSHGLVRAEVEPATQS